MISKRFTMVSALLLTAATAPLLAQGAGSAAQRPSAASRFAPWGVDLAARDMSIKPGDDFWRYANNRWFAANPIPADRAAWGVGTVLSEDVAARYEVQGIPLLVLMVVVWTLGEICGALKGEWGIYREPARF